MKKIIFHIIYRIYSIWLEFTKVTAKNVKVFNGKIQKIFKAFKYLFSAIKRLKL